jgi:hypothetical protein
MAGMGATGILQSVIAAEFGGLLQLADAGGGVTMLEPIQMKNISWQLGRLHDRAGHAGGLMPTAAAPPVAQQEIAINRAMPMAAAA